MKYLITYAWQFTNPETFQLIELKKTIKIDIEPMEWLKIANRIEEEHYLIMVHKLN